MSEITKGGSNFIGYEYKEILVDSEKSSLFLDGYINFGWEYDDSIHSANSRSKVLDRINTVSSIQSPVLGNKVMIKLKRDRKILNKVELTRLQRHFEASMDELSSLEKSRTIPATLRALVVGIIGTAFMAGSVFAVTATPPHILLCILFAIPAFIGWILPYFIYKNVLQKQINKTEPLIEQKYDEIYEICEKGNNLL